MVISPGHIVVLKGLRRDGDLSEGEMETLDLVIEELEDRVDILREETRDDRMFAIVAASFSAHPDMPYNEIIARAEAFAKWMRGE